MIDSNPIAITAPESSALSFISLDRLRAQCEIVPTEEDSDGVQSHPDDALITGYLESAIEKAEDFTGLAISLRTWEQGRDGYPMWGRAPIEILRPPLVQFISFTSSQDSDGEVDPATYIVDPFGPVARLRPVTCWPISCNPAPASMRLRFRAGYSNEDSDAKPLPGLIRQALLLTVAEWYKNRENTVEGAVQELPASAMHLLRPRRVRLGMA